MISKYWQLQGLTESDRKVGRVFERFDESSGFYSGSGDKAPNILSRELVDAIEAIYDSLNDLLDELGSQLFNEEEYVNKCQAAGKRL